MYQLTELLPIIDNLGNWPSDWLTQDYVLGNWATALPTEKLANWLSDIQTNQLTDCETD